MALLSGEQLALQTETDRDILAKSDAMSIDLHYVITRLEAQFGSKTTALSSTACKGMKPRTLGSCHQRFNMD